jgi:predicted phosphate transport protein (TIGR00153 family)
MLFGKRKETNYFEILNKMAECSHRAAVQLDEMMHNYTDVARKADEIHNTEHEADSLLHDLIRELNIAFITPIDREDLIEIGNGIDSITDSIEDVANLFDMFSINKVEPPALAMSELAKDITKALADAVKEFEQFRSSKKLNKLIIEVNQMEEKGDVLHRSTMKALFSSNHKSDLDKIKWKDIYDNMERIYDMCEDVADALEGLAVKNR